MKKSTPFFLIITIISSIIFAPLVFAQMTEATKKMAAEYRDKGFNAQGNRDFDNALSYYQKALELDPSLTFVYNDMGVIYEAKGWTDQAKKAYLKAIEADPSLASAYYNLGSIYEKEGDLERAIYFFKKRVQVGNDNDEWTQRAKEELKNLGVETAEVDPTFMDKDLDALEAKEAKARPKGNDLNPKERIRNAKIHLARGKQLYAQGRYSEAVMELGLAESYDGKNKEIQKTLEEVNRAALMLE